MEKWIAVVITALGFSKALIELITIFVKAYYEKRKKTTRRRQR